MEKQKSKKDMIKTNSPSDLKIIFALLTKTIIIYMQVFIIEDEKLSFKKLFIRWKVYLKLVIYLTLDKQFWGQFGSSLQIHIYIFIRQV